MNKTSKPQIYIFYAIAVFIPVLFFLLIELGLRVTGYGKDYPLFISNPAHESYVLPRPDIIKRYFPDNADLPSVTMEANFLLAEKPDNAYRIFVQGGSTAAGFPYGLGASIAGVLDQRIRQSMPGVHTEVVNTAMSAVNSYMLFDIADDIIEQQADAVFIYAGHNEYLGLLGIGSQYTVAGSGLITRWFVRLKDLRVFQLVQSIIFKFKQSPENHSLEKTHQDSRTFMSKVSKHKEIASDSSMFEAGINQFETNMSILLDKYEQAEIPVFLSTIASNLKDQAPFASAQAEPEFASKLAQFKSALSSLSSQQAKQTAETLSISLKNSISGNLHFDFASLAHQLGAFETAKTHYLLAKEHDLLRFRAPEQINETIRNLATKYKNVTLVDAHAALVQRSPNRIIGNNFMLEHLHPNLTGYYVISNSFYEAFARSQLVKNFKKVSIDLAWQQRLVLPAEEYNGFASIVKLKSDYPFVDTPQTPKLPRPADWQQQLGKQLYEKRIDWLTMMQKSLERYRASNQLDKAYKTLQILADALPHNGLYNLQTAEIMFKEKRFTESLHYYRRAKLAGAIGPKIDSNISF